MQHRDPIDWPVVILAASASVVACVGVAAHWPPEAVSRAVAALAAAAMMLSRRGPGGPAGAVAVVGAGEMPAVVAAALGCD